eukprot:Hpha_TRINITY_DN16175_c3_g5::TRINITY_DN16175_c3_g5_i1::g.6842::m.6842/K03039/PSMD13, RPN9; 26S proteasome regulatory subunit N9
MALTWLESVAQRVPDLTETTLKMTDMFERKLWHDLTVELNKAVLKPQWEPLLPEIHRQFISQFQQRMNPLALALLLVAISRRLQDKSAALELVTSVATALKSEPRLTDKHRHGALTLQCEGAVHLIHGGTEEGLRKAKELTEEATEFAKNKEAHEIPVELRAHTYRAVAAAQRVEGKYNEFYHSSLLYLAHVRLDSAEEIPPAEKQELAFNLGIAALLGDEIHNFGELINNPIITALSDGGLSWLEALLKAFNAGDLKEYHQITEKHQAELVKHVGEENSPRLHKKIQLMALLYHIFITPVSARTFSFQTVHEVCCTKSIDDVEHLLLHALALDLIRGSIDQVSQVLQVRWVRPRVLGRDEIGSIVGQVKQWEKRVSETLAAVEETLAGQVE